MVEAKKCARCGCMYIAENEVCGKCQEKDGADLYRLKGFFEKEVGGMTQNELSIATGISRKNLSRFLSYDEFKGICINEEAGEIEGIGIGGEIQEGNGIEELV